MVLPERHYESIKCFVFNMFDRATCKLAGERALISFEEDRPHKINS